jgi:hypothetical protein
MFWTVSSVPWIKHRNIKLNHVVCLRDPPSPSILIILPLLILNSWYSIAKQIKRVLLCQDQTDSAEKYISANVDYIDPPIQYFRHFVSHIKIALWW